MDQYCLFGALLTDLSKAFVCPPHDLLAARLFGYGFGVKSTSFLLNYLTNSNFKPKIAHAYSSSENVAFGVPRGLILGPLLFNIDLCDIFHIK